MKKIYGLVLFSLLANGNLALSMDAFEPLGEAANGDEHSHPLFAGDVTSGIIDDWLEVQGKSRLLATIKPGSDDSLINNRIDSLLFCIADADVDLIGGKPTVDMLVAELEQIETSDAQTAYLEALWARFWAENPDMAEDEEGDDEGSQQSGIGEEDAAEGDGDIF